MMLRKLSPYLTVVTVVLLAVLLLQMNTLSNTLEGLTGGAIEDSGSDSDSVAAAAPSGDDDTVEETEAIEVDIEDDSILWGNPDTAKVLIVEFSDYECPYCSKAVPTIEALEEEYGDDIAVVFKDFPLSFHANAQISAEAAECADEQGMFVEYHDTLFDNQGALGEDSLIGYAEDLGLDVDDFTECLTTNAMADEVEGDYNDGVAAGVRGTPGFIVAGELVSGAQPQSVFESIIDQYI